MTGKLKQADAKLNKIEKLQAQQDIKVAFQKLRSDQE